MRRRKQEQKRKHGRGKDFLLQNQLIRFRYLGMRGSTSPQYRCFSVLKGRALCSKPHPNSSLEDTRAQPEGRRVMPLVLTTEGSKLPRPARRRVLYPTRPDRHFRRRCNTPSTTGMTFGPRLGDSSPWGAVGWCVTSVFPRVSSGEVLHDVILVASRKIEQQPQ